MGETLTIKPLKVTATWGASYKSMCCSTDSDLHPAAAFVAFYHAGLPKQINQANCSFILPEN